MEIYEKIRTMREMNQWTQEEMAEKLDLSVAGYSKIERGKTKLNLDKLEQIANIFKIDIVELLNTKENALFLLIGDNNKNNSNYSGVNDALALENERLKLMLSHQEEVVEYLKTEINSLKEIINLLKKNNEKQ